MPNVPFSDFVTGLALDTIGGSEKLPLVDGSTNKHVTPAVIAAYVIDQLHGAGVITSLTDAHQLSVFTSGDDEKIITFANVWAWIVDQLEAITSGSTIVSGDTVLFVDGGVLKQVTFSDIISFINTTNGTLVAQIAALSAATLADTDQYVVSQSGTGKKTTFADIAARVHAQLSTYVAALTATVTPADSDKLYILQGATAKYVTLTVLANTYLAAELNLQSLQWPTSATTPSAAGDKLLMERSGTITEVDIDTLATYFGTGLQANILDFSGLTADTPVTTDLFVFDDGDPKKITLANLESKFWTDFATYVTGLTPVVTVTANDKFYTLQSGTPKYVTPVELAAYLGIAGYGTVYFDAGDMVTCTLNGAAAGQNESTTNRLEMKYYAFDGGATEERVQFRHVMPEDWNRGPIKARFFWSSASGSTAGDTVEWGIKAVAISDSDVRDASFGSAQTVTDTLLNNNGADLQRSTAGEFTIGGSPQLGDMIVFEVYRNTDGMDDMTEDAWLFGVEIQYERGEEVFEWELGASSSPSTSPSSSPSSSPSTSASSSPSSSTSSSPSTSPSSSVSSSPSTSPSTSPSASASSSPSTSPSSSPSSSPSAT